MTKLRRSTKRAKKVEKTEFYTEAQLQKDPTLADKGAPLVGGEFQTKVDDYDYTGQTIQVESKTKIEQDSGYGAEVIMRGYTFKANPELFRHHIPSAQELFESHKKGMASMLWQDGLEPALDIPPTVTVSPDGMTYLIVVGARAMMGQIFIDKPKTLKEVFNEPRQNPN